MKTHMDQFRMDSFKLESKAANDPPHKASSDRVETRFQQSCPVCGRILLIRVEYLGSEVYCEHCRCPFVATDLSTATTGATGGLSAFERAERLLASLETPTRSRQFRQ